MHQPLLVWSPNTLTFGHYRASLRKNSQINVFVRQKFKLIPAVVWFFVPVQFQWQPHTARNLKQTSGSKYVTKLIPLGIAIATQSKVSGGQKMKTPVPMANEVSVNFWKFTEHICIQIQDIRNKTDPHSIWGPELVMSTHHVF